MVLRFNYFVHLLVVGILFSFLYAGTTGKIIGSVKNKTSGEPLVGANIVLEGTQLGASTDEDGFFTILNVPPGTYNLTVYYVGYATVTIQNVRVRIDRTTTQNIKMMPEAVKGETVVVEAERPAIELDRTHSASVVSGETVQLMPVTEVSEILELQAGVVENNGELHFRGGRSREVAYVIDGVPVTNPFSQGGGSNVNVETNMISELEVISGTFNAEYGQAQSGVINIVTKRPSQNFSGSIQTYTGEWVSNKDKPFLGVSDFNPWAEKDIQFNLSGPIISEKLSFVLTGRHNIWESLDRYERRFNLIDGWRIEAYRRWEQTYGNGSTEGVIHIPDSLATGDRSRGPLRTGTSSSLNAKLIFSPHPRVTIIYQGFGNYDQFVGPPDPLGRGDDQFRRYQPDGSGTSRQWEYSQFLKIKHSPSDNFFYEINFSWQHNDGERFFRKDNKVAVLPTDEGIIPVVNPTFSPFSSGFSLGTTDGFYTGAPGKGFRNQYLATGNFNWQVDKHNFLKAGFELKKHFINVYGRGFRVSTEWRNNAFPSDPTTFGPEPLTYEQYWDSLQVYWQEWEDSFHTTRFVTAADSEVNLFRDYNIEPLEFSTYLQDKLELGDIIVNAGVRLDLFNPNSKVPINYRTESTNLGKDINLRKASVKLQLSPRLGISFPISSNGAFHASYGHFFQMPSFRRMFNAPLVTFTRLQLNNIRLGNADLKPERTIAYEIGLQQAITENLSVDITAYYKDFRNLLGIKQETTLDRVTYIRYVNRDYGNTRGISVGFTKRGRRVNGGANYTLAFANGSSSSPEALELINVSTQIGGESQVFAERKILPLDWDQRHAAKAYINFLNPGSWSVGLVGFLESGVPFNVQFVDRFDLNPREYRNAAFKPTQWSIDLKAKKFFKFRGLQAIIFLKVDNLFDHLNHEDVFSTSGRADVIAIRPEERALAEELLNQEGLFTFDEVNLNPDFFSPPRKIQMGLEIKF